MNDPEKKTKNELNESENVHFSAVHMSNSSSQPRARKRNQLLIRKLGGPWQYFQDPS